MPATPWNHWFKASSVFDNAYPFAASLTMMPVCMLILGRALDRTRNAGSVSHSG